MPFHLTIPAIDARLATQADLETLDANLRSMLNERARQFMTDTEVQARLRTRDAEVTRLAALVTTLTEQITRQGEIITAFAVRLDQLDGRLGAASEHVVHPAAFPAVTPHDRTTSEPAIGSATVGLVHPAASAEPVAATTVSDSPANVEPVAVVHVDPVPAHVHAAPPVTITTEQLGSALRAMATRRSLDAVRQLMAARGFPNASAVPQEHRADLLAAINAA